MKCKKPAFTLVELLTVIAIVAMLISLLIPSLTLIRNAAKEAKQKVQLTQIGLALTAFRNDYGDYPYSDQISHDTGVADYSGAQKLAEALLGRDLLGFHPRSTWSATDLTLYPLNPTPANLDRRKGPYLELGTESAFRLDVLYSPASLAAPTTPLAANTFVICDSFGVKKIYIAPGQTAKAGMPILYYRADTTKKKFDGTGIPPGSQDIYNFNDNFPLIQVADMEDGTPPGPGDHPLATLFGGMYFYNPQYKIVDQKIFSATARPWPHRPDSYILISAGADGKYGTADDICNFGN